MESVIIGVAKSPENGRITVPPPLPSARQQQLKRLLLDKTSFDDIKDLHLAAELGRTLLERNEELETELKQQQAIIDDQAQEIEFLTKQVSSMKEESTSRTKIYEQLETSISDLERTNLQLSRKHEVDKKRIQSLEENLDFLERKCEELTVTLQSLRNEQDKKSREKVNRSTYLNFGSDSSEEEMNGGYGLYRKRSHSLQDLRDYTPSPDEFDSGNSNSPDLKTSESEYVESLESKIEDLLATNKKLSEKVRQLESQGKLLVQENSNLQQQIVQINSEKEKEIVELRKTVEDHNFEEHFCSPFDKHPPTMTSTRRNSEILNPCQLSTTDDSQSMPFSSASIGLGSSIMSESLLCKRCSTEIRINTLINSIENDTNEVNLYDWDFKNPEDEMDFSSLEHELAKATGTPFRRMKPALNNNHVSPSSFSSNKSSRGKDSQEFSSNNTDLELNHVYEDNYEILDIFLASESKHDIEPGVVEHTPSRVRFSDGVDSIASSDITDDDVESLERADEDSCLVKDRKPEFSKNKGKCKKKLKMYSDNPPKCEEEVASKFLKLPERVFATVVDGAKGLEPENMEPAKQNQPSSYLPYNKQRSSLSGCEPVDPASCRKTNDNITSENNDSSGSSISSECVDKKDPVPEYKQILSSLFSLFHNSRRRYPIPKYPVIQEARRQSAVLIHNPTE